MNRFQNCKSLVDLHAVIVDENVSFYNLSPEETEKLVDVFNACTHGSVRMPLTEDAYAIVCAEAMRASLSAATTELNRNFKEEKTMNNNFANTDAVMRDAMHRAAEAINHATADVKVRAGMDVEAFHQKADASITTIKDATCSVLGVLDHLTGASYLKETLYDILYQDIHDRSSKRCYFDAAAECRNAVYNYIETLMACDPDEHDLRTIASLRYMVGEDEDGNPIVGHRSIFTAFANSIVWVCKKVTRKLKAWFGTNEETNIFGAVGASLASIFGIAAGVIGSVLKLALHTVIFVGSYVITAVIKAVSFIWDRLKGFGTFMKAKFGKEDADADAADDAELESELA